MCQAGLINNEVKWENWEWDEDEMDGPDKFFLELEHFGLCMSHLV